jgi:hypothetical protein
MFMSSSMMASDDARLPVAFGVAARPGDVLLAGPGAVAPAGVPMTRYAPGRHRIGCHCCGGRSPAAEALSRLFLAQARGELTFRRVVVLGDPAEVQEALASDRMVAARYRQE